MKALIAKMQAQLKMADLELLLVLTRARTLTVAADQLNVDPSTVFRAVKKLEQRLGERLFDRTREGYSPSVNRPGFRGGRLV